MTTVSDAFEAPPVAVAAGNAREKGAGARARVRARLAVTRGDGKLARFVRTVGSDVAGAWPWRGVPPTLAHLWRTRVPDIDSVPGSNRVLWGAWTAYNHAALLVTAPVYAALWVVQHPARVLLAAVVAAPLLFIWI